MVNFDMPPSAFGDFIAVSRYLYRLVDQMNTTLNNIDIESMDDSFKSAVQGFTSTTEKANALHDLLEKGGLVQSGNYQKDVKMLSDSIIASAGNVTASYESAIQKAKNEILSQVSASYYAADPNMSLEQKISSIFDQMADSITLSFITSTTITDLNDSITQLNTTFSTYFNFTADGLEIGKRGDGASPIIARLTNSQLQFVLVGSNVVIAYFDATTRRMHIDTAEVTSISIGNSASGFADITMDATAGLLITWRA